MLLVLQALLSFASCFGRGLARLRSLQLLTRVSRRACQLLAAVLYRMSHVPGKHEPDRHPKQATRDPQQGQAYRQKDDGNAQHDRNEPENGRDDPQDSTCESAENPHGSAGSGMRRKRSNPLQNVHFGWRPGLPPGHASRVRDSEACVAAVGRIVGKVSSLRRQKPAEGTQVDIEIFSGQAIPALQVRHGLLQVHEAEPEPLDLGFSEVSLVKPAQRLGFHKLTDQLDYRQHQFEEVPLDRLWIRLEPLRKAPRLFRHDPSPIAPCPPSPRRSTRAT